MSTETKVRLRVASSRIDHLADMNGSNRAPSHATDMATRCNNCHSAKPYGFIDPDVMIS